MSFTIVLALIAVIGGALVTYLYDDGAPLASRLGAGACIGFAALGLIGFIIASLLGLTLLALILTAALVALPFVLLLEPKLRAEVLDDIAVTARNVRRAILYPTLPATGYLIFYTLVSLLLWYIFDRAMFESADGIYTGAVNNYGDLPFHLSVITRFVYGGNFPPEDPTFAGVRFTYPFLVDFVAAMFVCAGASLRQAMFVENFVLALAFVGLLHRWTLELTRDRVAAIISPVLVLLSGGLGWWLLFKDVRESEQGLFALLMRLPHDYTIIPSSIWRWGNSLTTLLVPQRSILFGLPLAIIVFTQWWISLEDSEQVKRQKVKGKRREAEVSSPSLSPFSFLLSPSVRRMIAAGAVAGMLPLIHAHSFIVVMGTGACLALIFRRWRAWAAFFVVALLIGVPEMLWATHDSSVRTGAFFEWYLGWDRGEENIFWFWFKNTGWFIPLIVAAILWRSGKYLVSRRLLMFYLPFTLWFIVPNLVKLAPWVWDNIKVLFYWYVASVPLVALLLAHLWRSSRLAYRAAAVALLISLTLAGSLDVWRIVSKTTELREFDRDGIELAERIRQNTPPKALILHAPIHNHPVFLTGRRSLMGYPGHIWTHGLDFAPREADIKRMYAGGPEAEATMARYHVEYVVVSPLERTVVAVNDSFFERYAKVGEAGEYRLYKITRP